MNLMKILAGVHCGFKSIDSSSLPASAQSSRKVKKALCHQKLSSGPTQPGDKVGCLVMTNAKRNLKLKEEDNRLVKVLERPEKSFKTLKKNKRLLSCNYDMLIFVPFSNTAAFMYQDA